MTHLAVSMYDIVLPAAHGHIRTVKHLFEERYRDDKCTLMHCIREAALNEHGCVVEFLTGLDIVRRNVPKKWYCDGYLPINTCPCHTELYPNSKERPFLFRRATIYIKTWLEYHTEKYVVDATILKNLTRKVPLEVARLIMTYVSFTNSYKTD